MTAPRPARAGDLAALSALCLRAKAHWGYDAAFLEACRAELTLGPEDLAATVLLVAEAEGRPAGVAQVSGDGTELLKLYVDPACMGRGLGRRLFFAACAAARARGASTLAIEADPNAVPFYARMGAQAAGRVPSGSIPGRWLPRLVLALEAADA